MIIVLCYLELSLVNILLILQFKTTGNRRRFTVNGTCQSKVACVLIKMYSEKSGWRQNAAESTSVPR